MGGQPCAVSSPTASLVPTPVFSGPSRQNQRSAVWKVCPAGGEGSGWVCDPRLFGAVGSRASSPWRSRGLPLAAPDNSFCSENQ